MQLTISATPDPMVSISVSLQPIYAEILDYLVEALRYPSRSELVREALEELIDKEIEFAFRLGLKDTPRRIHVRPNNLTPWATFKETLVNILTITREYLKTEKWVSDRRIQAKLPLSRTTLRRGLNFLVEIGAFQKKSYRIWKQTPYFPTTHFNHIHKLLGGTPTAK